MTRVRGVNAAVYVQTMNTHNDLSAAVERVVAARHRLEKYRAHLDVALYYPRALGGPVGALELEDAAQLAASAVADEIQRTWHGPGGSGVRTGPDRRAVDRAEGTAVSWR